MAERIDYLGGLEKAGHRTEAEQREIDGRAGRFGIYEEKEGGAQVTAWQVPRQGQPLGPSPAFLGPQWSVGPAPDNYGAIVLDKRNGSTALLPPGAWLIRYEDGGEVVGIDGAAFAEAYTFLGAVGTDVTKKRAEPLTDEVNLDPGAPEPAEAARPLEQRSNGGAVGSTGGEVPGVTTIEIIQEQAWKAGYAARVNEEPLLREGREQAIRNDERAALNAIILAQRSGSERVALGIDGFVKHVLADNERLRKDLAFAIERAEYWQAKAARPVMDEDQAGIYASEEPTEIMGEHKPFDMPPKAGAFHLPPLTEQGLDTGPNVGEVRNDGPLPED
jgi:hypothetical protein